jgi:hypothetical protein
VVEAGDVEEADGADADNAGGEAAVSKGEDGSGFGGIKRIHSERFARRLERQGPMETPATKLPSPKIPVAIVRGLSMAR